MFMHHLAESKYGGLYLLESTSKKFHYAAQTLTQVYQLL